MSSGRAAPRTSAFGKAAATQPCGSSRSRRRRKWVQRVKKQGRRHTQIDNDRHDAFLLRGQLSSGDVEWRKRKRQKRKSQSAKKVGKDVFAFCFCFFFCSCFSSLVFSLYKTFVSTSFCRWFWSCSPCSSFALAPLAVERRTVGIRLGATHEHPSPLLYNKCDFLRDAVQ